VNLNLELKEKKVEAVEPTSRDPEHEANSRSRVTKLASRDTVTPTTLRWRPALFHVRRRNETQQGMTRRFSSEPSWIPVARLRRLGTLL